MENGKQLANLQKECFFHGFTILYDVSRMFGLRITQLSIGKGSIHIDILGHTKECSLVCSVPQLFVDEETLDPTSC